jgi:signal transduction histidine kinase
MNEAYPFSVSDLRALVPAHIETFRTLRYAGDAMSFALEDFAEEDRVLIHRLYDVLTELLHLLSQRLDKPDTAIGEMKLFVQQHNWPAFINKIQRLGVATYPHYSDLTMLSQVVHDIKGGGFAALSISLQLLEMGAGKRDDVSRLFFLSRDHLKIMRNAVRNIDPEGQRRDQMQKDHQIGLLVEKWDHAVHRMQNSSAVVAVDCRYDGAISERCLEFSALDRALYNLINNATRHTANGKVYLSIFTPTSQDPQDLRFVIYNAIAEEQQRMLREHYDNMLGELFRGGFTTDGSGIGMRICADFVNHAYGIHDFDRGLRGQYFGAQFIDDYFINWFHWPLAGA